MLKKVLHRVSILGFGLLFVLLATDVQAGAWIGIPPWEYQRDIEITGKLKLSNSNPKAGDLVSAEFTLYNHGQSAMTFERIGVSARGPNCYNLGCGNVVDFPLQGRVVLQPGQSFHYAQQRAFSKAGDHFAQLAFQAPGGAWYSLDSAANFVVKAESAQAGQPLKIEATTYRANDIFYAQFELRNNTAQTRYYKRVGVGIRDANGAIVDFPYHFNISIKPGESYFFRDWQQLTKADKYTLQIATLGSDSRWEFYGQPQTLTVKPSTHTPRTTRWRMSAHYHPVWNESDSQRLALAQSAGIDLVRVAVEWSRLQPVNGNSYDEWYGGVLREFLQRAQQQGVSVYLMVSGSPCWASADPYKNCQWNSYDRAAAPRNSAEYANMMTELVRRHGKQVVAWEVWNEPNIGRFWTNPNPVAYTDLLAAASQAIKAQQWNATVLGGALAGTDAEFLLGMYEQGAAKHYDALSIHPYATGAPNDCSQYMASFYCGVEGMRSLMLHNKDYKPVWFSEFGWSSLNGQGGVGEYNQQIYLRDSIYRIQQWDFVAVASWYNLIDTNFDQGAAAREHHMGLFYGNFRPKPAANWLKSYRQ